MSKIDTPHGTIVKCDICGVESSDEDLFRTVAAGEDACTFRSPEGKPSCYDMMMELDHELKAEDRAAMQEFKKR